ncbi:MAG: LacI family transcriptional regulator [Solirubrobacteraceae bacterium]|jgi:DNA-binding LacI/PurR family transcriptional regulator|nr:LacI family transcriptional regulator [Solirubrobacteraceae bacterium]
MAEQRPAQRRPTLADVAAAAGVSRATASRAMSGGPNVSPAARERVWAAVERLGFQPNHLARSLRRGSTMAIGLLVPDVAIAFYARALKGAQETLERSGYHVLVMNTERAADREAAALRTLRAHQVDGVIVATSGGFQDIGVPAVFFDSVPLDIGAGAVALCNEEGIGVLVDHLVDVHGHQRIAYLGPPAAVMPGEVVSTHRSGRERLDGFRAAMGRAGLALPPEYVRTSDARLTDTVATALTTELLALDRPPTAIVAGADTLTLGALEALHEQGVRVPDDIAIVSFDEPTHAGLLDPPVTSLDRHDRQLGCRAAELLLAALAGANGGTAAGAIERVPLELRVRRSCGCPAG